jgi:hypothetical protein
MSATQLIRQLTGGLPGKIELRAIPNDRKSGLPIKRAYVSTRSEIDQFNEQFDKRSGYGVYFGVVKRTIDKGTKDACGSVGGLWVDIDTVNHGWDTDACAKALMELPGVLMPSALLRSGGGLHAY